jgi:hypothetical protein
MREVYFGYFEHATYNVLISTFAYQFALPQ